MKALLVLSVVLGLFMLTGCADEDFDDPEADPREKFLNAWICKETIGSAAPTTFTIFIASYGVSDSVRISNFSGYGNSAVALGIVSGSTITIPSQQIGVTNIPVQGSGTYSSQGGNEKITMSYMTDGQSATAVCTR